MVAMINLTQHWKRNILLKVLHWELKCGEHAKMLKLTIYNHNRSLTKLEQD